MAKHLVNFSCGNYDIVSWVIQANAPAAEHFPAGLNYCQLQVSNRASNAKLDIFDARLGRRMIDVSVHF